MRVPCGQCIGCRIDRGNEWAARIIHESKDYDDNQFLTLTYRDKSQCNAEQLENGWYLPESGSLVKKHHQDFMKRLRRRFPGRRFRYYHAGEYGDENDRPHYHTCLFNLRFEDQQLYSQNQGYPLFFSQTLEDLWRYGFCTAAELSYQTASYVARYVLKKVTGPRAHDHYLRYDDYGVAYWLLPEYATMSTGRKKGDGIGANWFKQYHEDVFPADDLPVPGVGIKRGIPRYYETLMEEIDAPLLEEVKQVRDAFAKAHPERYTAQHFISQRKIYEANMARKRREL